MLYLIPNKTLFFDEKNQIYTFQFDGAKKLCFRCTLNLITRFKQTHPLIDIFLTYSSLLGAEPRVLPGFYHTVNHCVILCILFVGLYFIKQRDKYQTQFFFQNSFFAHQETTNGLYTWSQENHLYSYQRLFPFSQPLFLADVMADKETVSRCGT